MSSVKEKQPAIPEYANTPIDEIANIVSSCRAQFRKQITIPVHYRKQQLRQLYRLLNENREVINNVVFKDLRRDKNVLSITEFGPIINEIVDCINNLNSWTRPQPVKKGWLQLLDSVYVQSEPLGTVLIIGPWNYPLYLTMLPLVSAIAAGNTVIIKPSELTPHFAAALAYLLPKYLDPKAYGVILGGVPETTQLLQCKFDHIFYTGNSNVGRIVMAAAAKNLTPVTLELGGKCPVLIHEDVDLRSTAKRIAFGKFINCGQTCVAPDYILCPKSKLEEFVKYLIETVELFLGKNPQKSAEYGRVVNQMHLKRLQSYLPTQTDKETIVMGGTVDMPDLYLSPTILTNVQLTSKCMQQEIFGPILPILTYTDFDQAINLIRDQPDPLAIYVFSSKASTAQYVAKLTRSGSIVLNDTVIQVATEGLPFGGVGESGMGQYHGKYGFDTFTYQRSYLIKTYWLEFINSLRYPPYDKNKVSWVESILFKKLK